MMPWLNSGRLHFGSGWASHTRMAGVFFPILESSDHVAWFPNLTSFNLPGVFMTLKQMGSLPNHNNWVMNPFLRGHGDRYIKKRRSSKNAKTHGSLVNILTISPSALWSSFFFGTPFQRAVSAFWPGKPKGQRSFWGVSSNKDTSMRTHGSPKLSFR